MPKEKFSRNTVLHARLPNELRQRLDAIHARHQTNDTRIVLSLLETFCTAVEEADAVRFPVVVLLADKQQLLAAEDRPPKPPDKSQRYRGDGPRRAVS